MEITYVSHAGFWLTSRSGRTRLLLDPWLDGSTYMDQAWLAWSYPGKTEDFTAPEFLLFTHYHKDHFHPPSVERISRDSQVVLPETAASFFKERVEQLGFANVREISPGNPLTLGDFEVHALRINDHWEFLDETAYLIVEEGLAALFLADLWYLPPSLLRQYREEFHIRFAAVPWGGGLEELCVLPDGFRLDSSEAYYSYGWDEERINRRNSGFNFADFISVANVVDADYVIPGAFGFGMIWPKEPLVKPLPICRWLNQEEFVRNLPDPEVRAKSHPMYPGDRFVFESGFRRHAGSSSPNTPVTESMRSLAHARKNPAIKLDREFICSQFVRKIEGRISQLRGSSPLYQERVSYLLKASREIEFQIVNDAKQVFLFEQNGDRFSMKEVDVPSGAKDVIFLPPSVMASLVSEWGPRWTEVEFSTLVKVSSAGWAPYTIMKQLFC